jgi:hypothetical protein
LIQIKSEQRFLSNGLIEKIGVFKMHIFNSVYKTKYFIALALLLAFAFLVVLINIGTEPTELVIPKSQVNGNVFFDCGNISTVFVSPAKTEFFGKYEGVKGLKQRHNVVRQDNILSTPDFVLENHINSVYATSRIPYYTEVCKLLAQLIVIYIFMTDGKKRSYRLSYN